MTSIRITEFAGLMPELSAKLKQKTNAQIAHNCLLYDGRLQAMPAYYRYSNAVSEPTSLYRAGGDNTSFESANGRIWPSFELYSAVYHDGSPFTAGAIGIALGGTYGGYIGTNMGPPGISGNLQTAGISAPVMTAPPTINITHTFASARPSVVSYAVTAVRLTGVGLSEEESAPTLIATVGVSGTLYYEGDAVQISANLSPFIHGETRLKLYRSISALETGEELVNTFDTEYHLLSYVNIIPAAPVLNYTDVLIGYSMMGASLLTRQFLPPYFTTRPLYFGTTESGWNWFTSYNEIQFSERYLSHAWPISGYMKLLDVDTVLGATSFYDTVFVGTTGKPYRVRISNSEDDTIQTDAHPYPEVQPCRPNSLVTGPFGGIYTSNSGIVTLEEERQRVVSSGLLNGGDVLYRWCVDGQQVEFAFSDIQKAAWFNGWYIGFSDLGVAFVYDVPEDLNDAHPFQQLVTMDMPTDDAPLCWAIGDFGLHTAFGTSLYYWPVPGFVRLGDTPERLTYRWKSKRFVMRGLTNFAAAKVVNECNGDVCFKLYSDCKLVYERVVTDCQPFRLPAEYIGIEFEIELSGTGTVSEVHVATSMQDLTLVEIA